MVNRCKNCKKVINSKYTFCYDCNLKKKSNYIRKEKNDDEGVEIDLEKIITSIFGFIGTCIGIVLNSIKKLVNNIKTEFNKESYSKSEKTMK